MAMRAVVSRPCVRAGPAHVPFERTSWAIASLAPLPSGGLAWEEAEEPRWGAVGKAAVWSSYRLGKIFGVPVAVSPSWFIAFGLVIGVLALRVYPDAIPGRSDNLYWAMAFISGLLFFVSILLHELAHSVVAKAFGIPVHGITLFILGGVSHIAREAPKASQEFLMAFAGPATSLALGIAGFLLWLPLEGSGAPMAVVLEWLWLMNLGVALFNLVPGFPLDGGRVLRAALWGVSGRYEGATRWSTYIGRGIAWTIVAYGSASLLLGEDEAWAVDAVGGFWLIMIGAFLDFAARGTWERTQLLLRMNDFRVGEAVERDWPRIAMHTRIADVEQEGMLAESGDHMLVIESDRVIGLITGDIALTALDNDRFVCARDLMIPAAELAAIDSGHTGFEAWERMETTGVDLLPVVEGSRFLGVVRRQSLIRRMEQRSQGAL